MEARQSGTQTLIGSYRGDALGGRVEKMVQASGVTTRYLLDGVQVVEEFDGNGVWQARYVYEDGIDRPRCMDRADIADVNGNSNTTEVLRFHYHQQALGAVTEITQPSGAVVEWVTYDVYGNPTNRDRNWVGVSQSAVGNPYLFTRRELDPGTGLFFYRARHYDPATGRLLQRDPLGYVGGLGLYQYTRSSASVGSDLLGLLPPNDNFGPNGETIPGTTKGDKQPERPKNQASGLLRKNPEVKSHRSASLSESRCSGVMNLLYTGKAGQELAVVQHVKVWIVWEGPDGGGSVHVGPQLDVSPDATDDCDGPQDTDTVKNGDGDPLPRVGASDHPGYQSMPRPTAAERGSATLRKAFFNAWRGTVPVLLKNLGKEDPDLGNLESATWIHGHMHIWRFVVDVKHNKVLQFTEMDFQFTMDANSAKDLYQAAVDQTNRKLL